MLLRAVPELLLAGTPFTLAMISSLKRKSGRGSRSQSANSYSAYGSRRPPVGQAEILGVLDGSLRTVRLDAAFPLGAAAEVVAGGGEACGVSVEKRGDWQRERPCWGKAIEADRWEIQERH